MLKKKVRCTVFITPQVNAHLVQIAKSRKAEGSLTRADLIREAIRRYLDEQEDLIGSRRHFQKSFQMRIDRLEQTIAFQLNVITYLVGRDNKALQNAIIAARQHGQTLLAQMQAVRDLEIEP